MSNAIDINNFASELTEAFEDYTKDVTDAIQKAVDTIAKETVKDVKSKAPKKTGKYAKSFTQKKGDNDGERIVYNKKHYQRTHLLEHGHAKRGGGRTKAIEHIGPVRDKAVEKLEKQIEEIIKKGG